MLPPTSQKNSSTLPSKLAQRILAFIADNRIENGTHLGEVRLAEQLKVSRTPVRAALEFLAGMEIVEKRPNKGYFVKADPKALVSKPLVEESSEDLIYYRIVEDRLSGHLPERISELELMRRYGLTKSWLSNLLRRMSQEGWIERLPGKGWEFLPVLVSEEAYDQMYQFRMLIEPAALLQKDFHLSPSGYRPPEGPSTSDAGWGESCASPARKRSRSARNSTKPSLPVRAIRSSSMRYSG